MKFLYLLKETEGALDPDQKVSSQHFFTLSLHLLAITVCRLQTVQLRVQLQVMGQTTLFSTKTPFLIKEGKSEIYIFE